MFDEEYFKSNNYTNYLSKKERYVKTADELFHTLAKFTLINNETKILDYGCSVGFLIQGLIKAGCTNVVGYDISEWASNEARKSGCTILEKPDGQYELGIFLDVLEHMTDQQIYNLFEHIHVDKILVRIPCASQMDPTNFHLEVSRKDKTHINCKTDEGWIDFFNELGYQKYFRLNLNTIYDSTGCFCCIFV